MMSGNGKQMPFNIYKKIPGHNQNPDSKKRKIKFQNRSINNEIQLLDNLSEDIEIELNCTTNVNDERNIENSVTNDNTFVRTLTKKEVSEHINKCLEMSSENKITPKNAFALRLIDCMKLLLPKDNFSVMACTLDAGQKIYAHRIDSLHQQVIKLSVELVGNVEKNKIVDNNNMETEANFENKTRKSNKRNILASTESLRKNLKSKDPKEKFMKFGMLPGALMTSVNRDNQDLSFTLLNSVKYWPKLQTYKPPTLNETVTIPHCEIYRNKIKKLQTFDKNLSPIPNVIEAEVRRVPLAFNEQPEDIYNDSFFENGAESYEDIKVDEVEVIHTDFKSLNIKEKENKDIFQIFSRFETMKMLFNQDSDYHYYNKEQMFCSAGSQFWERSKCLTGHRKENKRTIKRKKYPEQILYSSISTEELILKKFKKGLKLNKKIMGWCVKNVTEARDLKINIRIFLDLFHMPDFLELEERFRSSQSIQLERSKTHPDNNDEMYNDDDVEYSPYRYDPLNSSFYENALEDCDDSEYRDTLNSAFYEARLNQQPDTGKIIKVQFSCSQNNDTNTSLVPLPNMIKFKPINYKTNPIRVDMYHLKQTMWSVINEICVENDEYKNGDHQTQPTKVKLSYVMKLLYPRLEKRTAGELSSGMALITLLTLANEKNLQLKNTNNYTDIEISLENAKLAEAVSKD